MLAGGRVCDSGEHDCIGNVKVILPRRGQRKKMTHFAFVLAASMKESEDLTGERV
jgi:hypothetical protein